MSEPPPLVSVRPPSASGESWFVLRAAIAVALATLFVISSRRQPGGSGELPLQAYQRRFADLPSPLQRDYRELREGYDEAARARSKAGAWPSPQQLASDGVPPFASDGVDGKLRDWQVVHDGRTALYFGVTRASANGSAAHDGAARPNLLLRVVESAPNDFESRDPNTVSDEEHQRLADGTLVHVTTWYREAKAGAVGGDGSLRPEMQGWTQMVGRAGVVYTRPASPVNSAPTGR